MSIIDSKADRSITLQTKDSSYHMAVDGYGYLRHLYYGKRLEPEDLFYLYRYYDRGFTGNPRAAGTDRTYSLDAVSQEFSAAGVGDYRIPALRMRSADGARIADLRYVSHEIRNGKYALPGLPAVRDEDGDAQTLEVILRDEPSKLTVHLLYGVFEKKNMITRAVIYENASEKSIVLEKAGSCCLELPYGNWDLLHFHGRHNRERAPERVPVMHGVQAVGSCRGMSSHQHNPFIILCDRRATEDHGDCYGLMYLYSSNFRAEVEGEQYGSVRAVMSPGDETFRWRLQPGGQFTAPEVLMGYADGLTRLSQQYHRTIRENICRGAYHLAHRPVLINSWEAAYFDISAERILKLAGQAADLGIELFVLDDGWFRGRKDDNAGLGDWEYDPEKLPEGLNRLIAGIRETGMLFGIWVEPEMVNEDSDLYRSHPDWVLSEPGRAPARGRNQLVLDLSREDVQDYIIGFMTRLLTEYDISYIKWDFNRCITDVYSRLLPPKQQGEVLHRAMLGLYRVLETLTARFPEVLFEGCSGGGGRFDAGMMYYTPQIWCSDDTDPIERLTIQKGTSFGYPLSTVGAHVSIAPNHQTGRSAPISTRAAVAATGAFGYELDLSLISAEEQEEIRRQVQGYLEDEPLIRQGLYYRLGEETEGMDAFSWLLVSEDQDQALLTVVATATHGNAPLIHLRFKGLAPEAMYELREEGLKRSGAALMNAGYTLPMLTGDYPAFRLHLKRVQNGTGNEE